MNKSNAISRFLGGGDKDVTKCDRKDPERIEASSGMRRVEDQRRLMTDLVINLRGENLWFRALEHSKGGLIILSNVYSS